MGLLKKFATIIMGQMKDKRMKQLKECKCEVGSNETDEKTQSE